MRTVFLLMAASIISWADSVPPPDASAPVNADEIIRKFAAKESEFAKARERYTYRQTVKLVELDANGNPGGKYELVEDILFTPEGKPTGKVTYAPVITLENIGLTPEDEQDLRHVLPFVLNTENIDNYLVRYLGKQQVDEIPCYSFAVKPKTMVKGARYFEGTIWVDDRDYQIVKTYGKGVGVRKKGSDNQYPNFATYRQQVDGKYWFPTYTIANDTLHFKEMSQRIKMTVKYEDYKQFKSETKITFGDEVETPPKDKKPETPEKPKQ
jgi:hypothetical protein